MSWQAWQVHFYDGKKALMLTDQCPEIADALIASFERFGKHRVKTVTNNQQVEKEKQLAPKNPFMEI